MYFATELVPEMDAAEGFGMNIAVLLGFFGGVLLMISLGILLPEGDDDEDSDSDDVQQQHHHQERRASLVGSLNKGLRQRSTGYIAMARKSCVLTTPGELLTTPGERRSLLIQGEEEKKSSKYPSVLVSAIAIDGFVDGLLIGITTAAASSSSAGLMMAASLSVEMGFLGITLAVALKGQKSHMVSTLSSLVGPSAIIMGAVLGGMLASALSHNPIYLVALLSFGTSALLYMVAEELLLEAHDDDDDDDDEHVWWVDLQLYVGFYSSIIMGKVLK